MNSSPAPASRNPQPRQERKAIEGPHFVWSSICGLSLVFLIPMLAAQAVSIAGKEPLWFAGVVLGVVGIASVRKMQIAGGATTHPVRWTAAVAGLALAAVLFALSVWNFSPWLAHLAAILLFFAWGVGRWGQLGWSSVGALTLLLLTTLPWPLNWDAQYDRWLKSQAGALTSDTLDAFQVANIFDYGLLRTEFVTFETIGLTTWGSVYALIAVVALVGILRHRSFLQTLLLVLLTPLVYVVLAYLCLFLCVLIATEGRESLVVGQLGSFHLVLFASHVVMLLLMDQCFAFLFRTVPVSEPDFAFLFVFTNKVLHWPQVDPQEAIIPEDPLEREAFENAQLAAAAKRRVWPDIGLFDRPALKWTALSAGLVIAFCGVFPAWLLAKGKLLPESPFRELAEADLEEFPSGQEWGDGLQDWVPLAFAADVDEVAELLWDYGWKGQRIRVTLSFPHQGAPLTGLVDDERLETGWSHLESIVTDDGQGKSSIIRSRYSNRLGGTIFVLRSAWGSDLVPVDYGTLQRNDSRRRRRSALLDLLDEEEQQVRQRPCYWLVAECETGGRLSNEEIKEFQSGFEALRDKLAEEMPQGRLEEFVE